MTEEYPLFPTLSEEGGKEAQNLIDQFKVELSKAADEALGKLYCDVAAHIESDSWTNYRNSLMDGFKNYDNRLVQGEHDFKEIRQSILKEHRDDLIVDLNQDMVKEISELKEHVQFLNNRHF